MIRFLTMIALLFGGMFAHAQISGDDISFFQDVLDYIDQFGGLPWMGKVAGGILILLATMKVSFLRSFWDKLGAYKALAAPVLGLIAGVLSLGIDPNSKITFAGVMAYIGAGAGAIIIHELLDAVKAIPGVGDTMKKVIDFIAMILGKPKA